MKIAFLIFVIFLTQKSFSQHLECRIYRLYSNSNIVKIASINSDDIMCYNIERRTIQIKKKKVIEMNKMIPLLGIQNDVIVVFFKKTPTLKAKVFNPMSSTKNKLKKLKWITKYCSETGSSFNASDEIEFDYIP